MGEAVSPKGTHAINIRHDWATVAEWHLRHEQGGGCGLRLRREKQSCGCAFRQAVRHGCSAGEGGADGAAYWTG